MAELLKAVTHNSKINPGYYSNAQHIFICKQARVSVFHYYKDILNFKAKIQSESVSGSGFGSGS